MIKNILFVSGLLLCFSTFAQTVTDFERKDCNGVDRHLFQDLDDGNVVILEFFMTNCGSCIVAGDRIESMKTDLLAEFPGKIKSYAIGYRNDYTCQDILGWVSSNSFTSIPMDSGALQVAYYGGMGMPTVVVLGGADHQILGQTYIGFSTSDTITIGNDVRTFFGQSASITSIYDDSNLSVYPNPTENILNISLNNDNSSEKTVNLKDLSGRTVYSKKFNGQSTSIEVSAYQAGNYLLEIQSNSQILTRKISIIH